MDPSKEKQAVQQYMSFVSVEDGSAKKGHHSFMIIIGSVC